MQAAEAAEARLLAEFGDDPYAKALLRRARASEALELFEEARTWTPPTTDSIR